MMEDIQSKGTRKEAGKMILVKRWVVETAFNVLYINLKKNIHLHIGIHLNIFIHTHIIYVYIYSCIRICIDATHRIS